tara:strand:+ start:392 stop:577 length:186 start_codon:yes stop_codon:yes gene_type:complete
MNEWISVNDRLPHNIKPVIVNVNSGGVHTSRYHSINGKWVDYNAFITHWMPLPEPPANNKD